MKKLLVLFAAVCFTNQPNVVPALTANVPTTFTTPFSVKVSGF